MSKLVECPNCLGTTEELFKGKFPRKCSTCKGEGMVSVDTESQYLSSLRYFIEDDDLL